MFDPEDVRPTIKRMLEEWKIHVFYRRMTLKEYYQRKEAVDEFMRRMGSKPVRPTGWVNLRKRLKEKDPDLKVPKEIQPMAYRGKY